MEGKKVKSAWEIALEKAERLGGLSPEELRQQEEEQYAPAGESLAERFLAGLPLRDVEITLGQQSESIAQIIRRAFLETVIGSIALAEPDTAAMERVNRTLAAVQAMLTAEQLGNLAGDIEALLREYAIHKRQEIEGRRAAVGEEVRMQLEMRGIAGTAVVPNLNAAPEWRGYLAELDARFEERLAKMKGHLLEVT